MNIFGISGTPRENGNSDILLQYALRSFKEEGWEIKHFRLSEFTVQPCRACVKCRNIGNCIIDDDMHFFYDAFKWCDALIVSTPVYSRNVSSQLLSVLDRYHGIYKKELLSGKVGGAIAVGRGTCGGQTIAINAIYNSMRSCGMLCVPGELNGVTATASEPGDILKQPNRLHQAEILGKNILRVSKRLRAV